METRILSLAVFYKTVNKHCPVNLCRCTNGISHRLIEEGEIQSVSKNICPLAFH